MTARSPGKPMQIKLSQERQERLVSDLRGLFSRDFDQDLSEFQARQLIDFLIVNMGAPIYNQAIQDARTALQSKLDDLDGEFYEPEPD